jgi:hypothetical protein
MPVFPKIQGRCPYADRVASAMDGDICRICDRQVVDLTAWTDEERIAFVAGRTEEVCVSYRLPIRPALAAAALAAAVLPAMAAAQDAAPPPATQAPAEEYSDDIVGVMSIGAIKNPAFVEFMSAEELAAIPEAPVTYEDEDVAPPSPAKPGA